LRVLRVIYMPHLIPWSESEKEKRNWWWIFRNGILKNWWNDIKLLDVIRPRMNMSRDSWMHFDIRDACYSIGKLRYLLARALGQRRLTDSRYNSKIFQAHSRRMTLPAGEEKDEMDRSCIIFKFCEIIRDRKKFRCLHSRNK